MCDIKKSQEKKEEGEEKEESTMNQWVVNFVLPLRDEIIMY